MSARFSAARVWAAIEDWLIPTLRLSSHERSLYYHLLRRTRLVGRRFVWFSRPEAARVSGLSTDSARRYLRVLVHKQCVRVHEAGPRGYRFEVLLPHEIDGSGEGALAAQQLALVPYQPERNAAGQPRAWSRSDPLRLAGFRQRILQREGGRCFYCRRVLRPREWAIDHVVPVAAGGGDAAANTVACCLRCNSQKGVGSADEYLRSLLRTKVLTRVQLRSRLKALRSLSLPQPLTPGP